MNTQTDVQLKAAEAPLPRQNLKAERVQEELTAPEEPSSAGGFVLALDPGKVQERLKAERVQEALKALPGWRLRAGGKAIDRAKAFPTSELAAMYGAFVTRYAATLGLPVLLNVSGGQVVITLHAPRSRGRVGLLTEAVLDFARRLG